MSVEIVEDHQAVGSWTVDVDWNPELVAELFDDAAQELPRKVHLLVYDPDAALTYVGLFLGAERSERGYTLRGCSPLWWLGADGVGPQITEREYVSGNNKLGNPIFAFGDLYWREIAGGSAWVIAAGVVNHTATTDADDPFESDELFPARPGQVFGIGATLYGGAAGPGTIRLRTTFGGRFDTPNLFGPYSAWGANVRGDINLTTDPLGIVDGPVYAIQTAIPNLAPNGAFDDGVGLNGWVQGAGAWFTATDGTAWSPPTYAYTDTSIVVAGTKRITSDALGGVTAPATPRACVAGEEWEVRLVVRTHPATTTDGEAFGEILLYTAGVRVGYLETEHIQSETDGWVIILKRLEIPDGVDGITFAAAVSGHSVGQWDVDSGTLIRTKGNVDQVMGPAIIVTPERPYSYVLPYRLDAGVNGGRAQMRAMLLGGTRDAIVIEGPDLRGQNDTEPLQYQTWDVSTPSGYDQLLPILYSEDVVGGAIHVGEGTMRDADSTTKVVDLSIGPAVADYTPFYYETAAPDGTETVRMSLVAEGQGAGYSCTYLALARVGIIPATGDAIIADLLAGLSVVAGDVDCPEVIPYDWMVTNLTNREALAHYCGVVSEPAREYRINPALPPTLDVGVAEDIFTDHAPDSASPIVLIPEDMDVEPLAPATTDAFKRPTHVTVIGATRKTLSGRDFLVTATSPVPGGGQVDWYGNPFVRTEIVSDASVDHPGYAQALADDLAAARAHPDLSFNVTLTASFDPATGDIVTRPPFREGDWIYVENLKSGIFDDANATTINGRDVRPRRVRIFTKARSLGPGYQLLIRRENGTTFDLATETTIAWSDQEATVLTVGDRRPRWEADPQGRSAGEQYFRDRKGRPR